MNTWLMDTGPLVALLVGSDSQHLWSVEQTRHTPTTVLTCDAVLSEALFLLKRARHNTEFSGLSQTWTAILVSGRSLAVARSQL
ncbi:MAG: hypothetical protein AB7T07_08090 [Steroidobacteraceae bacterium]